jgi:protein O-GlcNAc transferase
MNSFESARQAFVKGVECLEKQEFTNAERLFTETLKHAPHSIPALINLAIVQCRQERFDEANETARRVSTIDPNNLDAYSILSTCQKAKEQYEDVVKTCDKIISIDPKNADSHSNRGFALAAIGRHKEAIESYDRAIAIQPHLADAFLNRGNSLENLRRHDEALVAYDKVVALKPASAEAWLGRGNVSLDLKRYDDALAAYDRAVALKPDSAEASLGRGNVFLELKRPRDALAAYDKAVALRSNSAGAWLGRGNILTELQRYDEAFAAYDKALAIKVDLAEVWLGRGNILTALQRYDEAFAAYDKALALEPDLAEIWLGRGNILTELQRYDEAFAAYDKALAIKVDLAEVWLGRGNVFSQLQRHDDAFVAYDKAFALKPELEGAEGARLHSKMHLCDWTDYDEDCSHLISSIRNGITASAPFHFLGVSKIAEDQNECTSLWTSRKFPPFGVAIFDSKSHKHDRIRIAYVSADFHQHATSCLMAGMFECHDRSQFEITAISIGPDDASEMRRRLKKSFDNFVNVKASADQIASRIKQNEIDIAVDLKGFTQSACPRIFAQRCAPIQVNYLGYPGTLSASYIDYLIADRILIPETSQDCYAEKIAYLPNSYQVNDSRRVISDRIFPRAEVGLPEHGFVFCCFNHNYKVTPDRFECWMRILKRVEDSVLWLLEGNATAASNLRKEAIASGIDPQRLVFAKRMPIADHLARQRLADLFLDTLPCNAHTTASDALWAGLPILTQVGETFAGRVAASLLNAIGLPELITSTSEAYEDLAIELAFSPEILAHIKQKIADNRLTTPLFDTRLFTRHIEAAYTAMYERYQAGLPPDHIYVPE